MQDTRGYNPYKFGMAGGSDSHNTGSPYRQDNFFGLHADADGTLERRFAGVLIGGTMDVRLENPGGLTGVWAEENTRASIWDAMYRKETFGVSGPHIKVRFFGGWGYGKDILNAGDWVKQSYAGGVPMGADLPPMPSGGKGTAPSVRRLGGEGPDLRQSRPHPDRQGLDEERPELREDLRRRLVRRPQARQVVRQGSRDPEHGGPREGHLHQQRRLGGTQDGVERIRSSTPASTRSTTPACWRFRRRGGPSSRP